jgi:hypothetical protein
MMRAAWRRSCAPGWYRTVHDVDALGQDHLAAGKQRAHLMALETLDVHNRRGFESRSGVA